MTSTAATVFPDTPVGRRAAWLLDRLQVGPHLTETDLTESWTPEFLAQASTAQVLRQIAAGAGMLATMTVDAVAETEANSVTVRLRGSAVGLRLLLSVQPDEPHRIASLTVEMAAAGEPVDGSLLEHASGPAVVSPSLPAGLATTFDDALQTTRADGKMAGLLGALVKDGNVVYFRGLGVADAESHTQMTPETTVRIGSASKTFTAIAVMQLRDRGLIDLQRPVNDYLTSYSVTTLDDGPPVTVAQMLTHTSGIVDPGKDLSSPDGQPIPPLAELYDKGLTAKGPGREWAYSNHAFATLGQLVEDVCGRPFGDYMRSEVFDPLGMTHSDYYRTPRLIGPVATPYGVDLGTLLRLQYTEIATPGAGSVFSTATDMATYMGAITSGGGGIIDARTLAEMLTVQFTIGQGVDMGDMGYGFIVVSGPVRKVWHNGGWPGASTSMWMAPDLGLGVFLHSNTLPHESNLDALASELLSAAADAYSHA